MIHIIDGNTKMGKTSNISLPPIISCFDYPCKNDCYAVKFYKMYPEVTKAWNDNLKEVQDNPENYFTEIRRYLLKKTPKYFRWHVSGDILDQNYLDQMKDIANDYYFTNFLAFTKGYHLDFSILPNNLSIILSIWPNVEIPSDVMLPYAFIDCDMEDRIFNAVKCPGLCEDCRMCWNLTEHNIFFKKH